MILDVDNTLSTHHGMVLCDGLQNWLDTMRKNGIKLVILSNSTKKRVKPFAEKIDLDFLYLEDANKKVKRLKISNVKKLNDNEFIMQEYIEGVNLSSSISAILFNQAEWDIVHGGGALTALILFLLMSIAQAIAMLLPQFMQKAKAKKVARLGRNPATNQQSKNMQIFTWVMLAIIIFMGFSLASGMGVYWLIGAVFSVAQTLITQVIVERKKKEK